MSVDMNLLKQLRQTTQAPLKDCKDVLEQSWWDLDKAMALLKEKGLAQAAKKADRETHEWRIGFRKKWDMVFVVKLACETDFAAKNEWFKLLVEDVLDIIEKVNKEVVNINEFDKEVLESQVNTRIAQAVGSIWENMKLIDVMVKKWNSVVYNHMDLNKLVTVVFYEWEWSWFVDVAKEIALQVTAMNPQYLSIESIPVVERNEMKAKHMKSMEWSWKPVDIIDKIVEWKMSKEFEEIVLMEQIYIRDDSKKIKHIVPNWFKLVEYARFWI